MRSLILLFVVACGSTHTPSSDAEGVDALSADQACDAVSMARCARLQSCSPALLQRRWPDLTTCEAREKLSCTDALAAPSTAASPTTVEACAVAITAGTCDDFLAGAVPAACLPMAGSLATGTTCEFAGQCMSAFCALAPNTVCGTCQAAPIAGSSCATQGCGPTMVCVATTQTCAVPQSAGGACSRAEPCGDGLACVGATMAAPGTCTAQLTTAGATCDPLRKTGPDCSGAAGLTCNTMTKQCVAQPLAAPTMPCGLINNVETRCAAGAVCEIATGQTAGTCVAPAADNAACDTAAGPDCEFPARCVTDGVSTAGTCKLPGVTTCP